MLDYFNKFSIAHFPESKRCASSILPVVRVRVCWLRFRCSGSRRFVQSIFLFRHCVLTLGTAKSSRPFLNSNSGRKKYANILLPSTGLHFLLHPSNPLLFILQKWNEKSSWYQQIFYGTIHGNVDKCILFCSIYFCEDANLVSLRPKFWIQMHF